ITEDIHNSMNGSQVKKDDVLINITGASIGRTYVFELDEEANVNQHVCILRPIKDKILPKFLMLQLQSDMIQNQIKTIEGASREGLTNSTLKNYYIYTPSIERQMELITEVKTETIKIDQAIAKAEKEIELIKEYREAMIAEAVLVKLHHKIMGNRSEIPNSSEEPMPQLTNQKEENMQESNFLLYTTPSGDVRLDVMLFEESIWLTQKAMAELFSVGVPAISKHLANIFESGELVEDAVISILETTASDGKNYKTKYYNLDAIISVGYRVNSAKATQFRIWATKTLKEYIIKGFTLDDERLKQGKTLFGKDYFKELLERVRTIRASELRIYQQVTDIFAECSIDYDPQSPITKDFYATVQNKFHYAITGKTAAEIIFLKADSKKENMGLTTWKNA